MRINKRDMSRTNYCFHDCAILDNDVYYNIYEYINKYIYMYILIYISICHIYIRKKKEKRKERCTTVTYSSHLLTCVCQCVYNNRNSCVSLSIKIQALSAGIIPRIYLLTVIESE